MRTWILQRWQTYARVALLTTLVLQAVWFFRPTLDVFNLTKITILWVFGLLSLVLWVVTSAERGVWVPKLRLFRFAAAFLGVELLATLLSQDRGLSFVGLYHRYGGFLPFALYATIALMIVGLYWERPEDLKEIPRAFTIACVISIPLVLWQSTKIQCAANTPGPFCIPWRDSNGAPPSFPVGTMGNSNFEGGFLAMAVPMFAYVVVSAKKTWTRALLALAFILDLACLWFTQTRGALIAVGASAVVAAFLYRDRLPRWVRRLALAGAVGGVLVGFEVLVHPFQATAPALFAKAGAFSPLRIGTLQDRSYYWITGLRIFKHHPILGTGPDTYYANYPVYRLAKDGAKLGLTITDKPHNIFIEYVSNSGILGLGTYLAMVGAALWYGYRRVSALGGNIRILLVTFMATLVAYLTNQFLSIDVPPLAVMGWIAIAGIAILADPSAFALREEIAAARAAQRPKGVKRKKAAPGAKRSDPYGAIRVVRHGQTRWAVHGAAVVVALVLIVIGIRPFWADHVAHNGQQAQANQASASTVVATYLHAASFHPLEPSYPSLAGSIYEAQASSAQDAASKASLFDQALANYRRALKLQPENVFYVMNVARVFTTWGGTDPTKYPQADGWWKRAITEDPTDWQVHNQYAVMLNSWANTQPNDTALRARTVAELETVARIKPTNTDTWVNLAKIYLAENQTAKAKQAATTALTLSPTNADAESVLAAATSATTGTAATTATSGG